MMKITQKIATGVATGALLLQMAQPAFAATYTITNSTNGRDSSNTGAINVDRTTNVYQSNNVQIDNNISQDANTGDNKVKDNLGGGVDVTTGDVNQDASVKNSAGQNIAQLDQCDCGYDVEIVNDKNGRESENTGSFNAGVNNTLLQYNTVDVDNKLNQNANTGNNDLKDNNSDDGEQASLSTGSVDQDASVQTSAGSNHAVLGAGNGGSSFFSLQNSMNGRESVNNATANVDLSNYMVQTNEIDVDNDVDQDATTGDNDLKDNFGEVNAMTGDVDQDIKIMNAAGANALAVDDCLCDVDVEILNEKNGRESENDATLTLGVEELYQQFNDEISFDNDADQSGDTGANDITDNNSDDLSTGDVDSDVEVQNQAGHNVIGNADLSDLGDWGDSWNGASILMMLLHLLS